MQHLRFGVRMICLGAVCTLPSFCRARGQELTATEILARVAARNAERQQALDAYAVERVYRFTYMGIGGPKAATIEVHAESHGAGEKQFRVVSESGSKILCDTVLKKLVEGEQEASRQENQLHSNISPANYTATLVGEEMLDGRRAWSLDVAPRVPSKFTYRGRIWVSREDYAVMRVLGEPARNPSLMIGGGSFDYRYRQVGIFWLPSRNVSVSHVRLGGEAKVTIDYGAYTVKARDGAGLVSMLK